MPNTFYNAFDEERLVPEDNVNDYRSTFQIDRDRILHTSAFRQLQSKTQVFLSGEYDFYRTRLTHSLEVAQIGRSISYWLKASSDLLNDDYFVDPDLVEASCLSHDLGHPPFGHAGERSLNNLLASYGGFEGNAQTLRLITKRIFSQSGKGMNPTRAFADSVLKYKTLWSELKEDGKAPQNHFLYDEQFSVLDWVMGGNDFPSEYIPGKKKDSFRSVECQIMDWADDTAYSLNDLSDSVKAGFLTIPKLERWATEQDLNTAQQKGIEDLLRAIRRESLDAFAGKRIGKYIQSVSLTEDVNFMSGTSNRYRYRVVTNPDVQSECNTFKKLAYELVFLSSGLKQLEFKGNTMLSELWETLSQKSSNGILPSALAQEMTASPTEAERLRLLSDFLSGLTDLSARKLYRRLFDPSYGSITELLG